MSSEHPYLQKVIPGGVVPDGLSINVYAGMLALWHSRPDVQRKFPLHRGKVGDYWRWVAWCATKGVEESKLLQEISAWEEELSMPIALPELSSSDAWNHGFSLKMFLHGVAHYGYYFAPILKNQRARHCVARCYWRGERHYGKNDIVPQWQLHVLKKEFKTVENFLKTLQVNAWEGHQPQETLLKKWKLEDVAQAFSDKHYSFSPAPRSIILPEKINTLQEPFHSRLPRQLLSFFHTSAAWIRAKPNEKELASVTEKIVISYQKKSLDTPKKPTYPKDPFGINIFGYARGELGIGEDLRQMALAFKSQEIPFCIINIPLGKKFSQKDDSMDPWITDQPRYGINLFCMNGVEMVKFLIKEGLGCLENRITIGLWPWELPLWPQSCHYAFACVDTIWAISSYTASAYVRAPCQVITITLPVSTEKIGPQKRGDFRLPENAFLYLFCFDLHSRLTRKNPWGVIQAFQKAFPHQGAENVGLVLKVSHTHSWRWPWPLIRLRAKCDSRIHLLEKNMRRDELLALYQACDCYVSLHRAEGFGRTIAEALLLGLQVITTGFSGNLDFCQEPRVALVKYKPKQLKPRDYFWGEGGSWADPSIEDASRLLQEIRSSPRITFTPIIDLSPQSLGRYYVELLREIWNSTL
ncbi:MAG: glycosyltransferase [Chthoniobacterales bacterium]